MTNWVSFTAKEVLEEISGQFLVDVDGHGRIWIPTKELSCYGEGLNVGAKNLSLMVTETYAEQANLSSGHSDGLKEPVYHK